MRAQTTTGGVPERKVPPNSIRGAAMRGVVARPGHEAVEVKGWLRAHKWLLLRRASQLGILALFLVGPWLGWWIVKGNLASSLTLGVLPLTDPFLIAQQFAQTRHIAQAGIQATTSKGRAQFIDGEVGILLHPHFLPQACG